MPVHDWTRVNTGIFHHFHQRWISEISDALNSGRLPPDYYALAEQVIGEFGPDVLALKFEGDETDPAPASSAQEIMLAVAPPKVRFVAETEMDRYAIKQNSVVIRHTGGDEIVALVELVSPGNKSSGHAMRKFVEKVATVLARGYHLLIVDLHPPGPRDLQGIHGAIWEEIADDSYRAPSDKPLTLVSYSAGLTKRAFVEPVTVGDGLPDMPLFLRPGRYIPVPLEATYQAAWKGVPRRWQRVLEGDSGR